MKSLFGFLFLVFISVQGFAQIRWHSPANDPGYFIQGQGWPEELKGNYTRLPERARTQVRPEVWNLSQNSAGVAIHFYTNAPQILIRYQVKGAYAMPHMPSTGTSGIDLYARDMEGKELWCAGKYSFGDTIRYTFHNLSYGTSGTRGYEYHLYLPPYNTVSWLEIGTPQNSTFEYLPRRPEKPIVVYGTSIAQGACASRPGMTWTSILERKLDQPLINLGFSGNGRLEKEMLDLVNELDARLFILDCMPNLTNQSVEKIEQLLTDGVLQIREKHPQTPILITEHDGYSNQFTDLTQAQAYLKTNEASQKAFASLKSRGIPALYYLSCQEIGMTQDAMVDGVHATDYGMLLYANAYEQKIREILGEPAGNLRSTRAVTQRRDFPSYEWKKRHEEVLQLNRLHAPRAVILGNSIVHYSGGLPEAPTQRGKAVWDNQLTPAGFHNLGFGWDKIENMLWRIYHGELDGYQAEKMVVLAGTNNLETDTDEDILCGIDTLISAIRNRQPQAELRILGIFPRRNMEQRIKSLNRQIEKLTRQRKVQFADPGRELLTSKGIIDEHLFTDGLHPNEEGYKRIVGNKSK